ncbi:MAG TPA: NHL repeat-containing protein [Solirubrobacteraceae bacterium]|nr:NHL repeat-containing protein [Solirubrobacteraceae bacterium]
MSVRRLAGGLAGACVMSAFVLAGVGVGGAQAAAPPVKLKLRAHFGREVNLTQAGKGVALEDVCTTASKDTCGPGRESSIAGGFATPTDVAVAPGGNVFVADRSNRRVQELTAAGGFVLMFGGEVNLTKVEAVKAKGGTPTQAEVEEEDVCTAASGDVCKEGVAGGAAGQLYEPGSVAVDAASGDVYVLEDNRVDEFTAEGRFVWAAGGRVNQTKVKEVEAKGGTPTPGELEEENLCTATSKDVCQAGVAAAPGSGEHRAFNPAGGGDLLAVGPGGVLFVGDEGRVQELDATGTWLRQLNVAGRVRALAVDETGNVYLAYVGGGSVLELSPGGQQLTELLVASPVPGASVEVASLALDANGRLAVGALASVPLGGENRWFGSLYEAASGHLVSGFTGWGSPGIAFGASGELYAAAGPNSLAGTGHEVTAYEPVPIAELVASPAGCVAGAESESDVTLACTLHGEVNPEGVGGTEAFFQYGTSCGQLGSETPRQGVATGSALVPVGALVEGLRPNQAFCDQLAGNDANVPASSGETLTSTGRTSFTTPLAPPNVVGEPQVSFVKGSSAVMFAELNPENARAEYLFEYGPGETLANCTKGMLHEACPGVAGTPAQESACPELKPGESACVYGKLGVTLEATGLQPGTLYHYRLFAQDENTAKTETRTSIEGPHPGAEGQFTTAPAPLPQAVTGPAGAVGATTATITGSVNPDGLPATYAFELGVYEGSETSYGIVLSASAGSGTSPVQEALELSGLQPGTSYAYRITVSSGYIPNATHTLDGEPAVFTTAGLPAVISPPLVLAQLPIPAVAFPTETASTPPHKASPKCKKPKKLSHGRCVTLKRKKARKSTAHKARKHN